ncbi:tape measure protein [Microbacterium oryzae]|uniref:tape measure protein n=1 Tax=Microbacterium oryzae TaxID=743009 RepID=UPI0025B060D7|nr:tape measure protein [Microbacterium oryzae]MDN3309557.1 tape measure protein [Microbacterium oryzae]
MSSEVGSGHVSIFPVLTGFKSRVAKETRDAGARGAKTFEGGFKGAGTRAGRALGRDMKQALTTSAGDVGAAALGKLKSEVASAASALSKARLKQQDEVGKVRIAEVRLQEAIAKSGAASSQAVAAEERLAAARRQHLAATDTVVAASNRLKSAQDAVKGATDAAAGSAQRGAGRLAGFRSAAAAGLSGVVGAARSAGSAIGSALSSGFEAAQTASGVALGVIGAKIGSLAPDAVRASDAVDKFRSTLSFAGIDTGQIDALTASTQKYADQTVYELSDIQSVTAQLAANSVKDFDRLAEAGGNLNAVAGGNAETFKSVGMVLTQTAGQGKLTTENWNQLADAIPGAAGKLQDALKSTGAYTGNFRDAMAEGQISAEEFNAAILDLGMTDVAREAATSTKTIEGAMGNLDASITGGLVKTITPLKPLITGALSGAANGFTAFFDRTSKGVEGLVSLLGRGDFTGAFREAFNVEEDAPIVGLLLKVRELVLLLTTGDFTSRFREMFNVEEDSALVGFLFGVRDAFTAVRDAIPNIAGLVAPLVAALGAGGLASIVSSLGPLGALLPGLGGALAALGSPLGIVAAGLAGLALSGADLGGLVSSVTGLVSNLVAGLPALVPQITGAALTLVQALIAGIVSALPTIITAAVGLVTSLIQGIVLALPLLVQAALQLVNGLLTAIIAALPVIIEGGITLLMAVVTGLITALPLLLEAALQLVMGLLSALVANLPMLIEAGIQLLLALTLGLLNALPQLLVTAVELVVRLVAGLITMLPQLIEAGITLILALIEGLITAIPQIVAMLPQIVDAIWNGLADIDWAQLGKDIVQGLIDGLGSMIGNVGDMIGDLASTAWDGFTDFFGIHSPSRLMRGAGVNLVEGAVGGVEDEAPAFGDSLVSMARNASGKAQRAMDAVSATVSAAATVSGSAAANAGSGGGSTFIQNNQFAHVDPEVGIQATGQRLSAVARRAGVR